jgi:small subunit ribosomal protein S6
MILPAPTYDLVLLLDPAAEEAMRAKIVADARAAIEARGEFLRHDEWGDRALTYPIDRKAVAEYHLLQFHAGTPELLSDLDRSLRIADGILRFRIVRLKPGVATAPNMGAGSAAGSAGAGDVHAEPAAAPAAGDVHEEPPPAAAPSGDVQAEPAPAPAGSGDVQAEPAAAPGEPG